MNCPNCGFDRILPMYKVCPKCKQPLNASASTEAPKSAEPQPEPNTKLFTGIFWSYPKAMKDPVAFKEYASKNPNDSARLLIKWKGQGLDVSELVDSHPMNTTTSTTSIQSNQSTVETARETENSTDPASHTSRNDIGSTTTRNRSNSYITWTIAQGQFARNVSAQEVTNMSDADGVYVQEGVTAIIFVDGVIVSELEGGGLYKFASSQVYSEAALQYAEDEEDKRAHEGIIRKIGRAGRSLLNLVFGKSDKARHEDNKKRRESIKEIAKKISGNSVISVVLKRDGVVSPIVMGIRPIPTNDGGMRMEFTPYEVHTKTLTINVAVEFEARIVDFREFRTTYLMDKNSYSSNDLCLSLNNMMRTSIQRILQNYEADGNLLPAELMASISYELMNLSREYLHGVAITNVFDITTSNENFDRFRMLAERFFCAEKEIEAVTRTNEFKNRLQTVENQQRIDEAKIELDLRKELDRINNDQLIHEDEMESFVQLLQSQKRIREARTENEELAELLKLKGNRLVSEDELDALESSIRDKKFDRDQVSATFQLNSAHRTEMTRVKLESELQKNQLLAEAELNDIRFEELRKNQARQFQLDDAEQEHDLAATRRQDDYSDSRREKDFDFEQRQKDAEYNRALREEKDKLNIENQRADTEMERKLKMQQAALQATLAMDAQKQQHEQEMAEKKHKEEMARIAAQQNMSAEQLMASGMAGMDASAQKAFAESFSANKNADMYERLLKMQAEGNASSQAQQTDWMKQMMAMMQGAMQMNANMATNMATGQAAQQQANLDAIQNIAGARMSQTEAMKEEYRKQMEHEQKRTDAAQDKALNYTTKVTQEEIKATAKAGESALSNEEQMYFYPVFSSKYTLKEIGNFILDEVIDAETELEKNGVTLSVAEMEEFFPFLNALAKKKGLI